MQTMLVTNAHMYAHVNVNNGASSNIKAKKKCKFVIDARPDHPVIFAVTVSMAMKVIYRYLGFIIMREI